jgi:hypothetical protein
MTRRYAGLRPNPGALGVTPLDEGEASQTLRVRGPAEVIAWAASLTAAQRGELLSEAYREARLAPALQPVRRTRRTVSGDTARLARLRRTLVRDLEAGAHLSPEGEAWALWHGGKIVMNVVSADVEALHGAGLIAEARPGVWHLAATHAR